MKFKLNKTDFYKSKPFTVFEINNFCSDDLYLNLKKDFPNKSYFTDNIKPSSKDIFTCQDPEFKKFLKKSSSWNYFYENIKNENFIKSAYFFSLIPSLKSRGLKALKIWTLKKPKSMIKKLFFREVEILFNFFRITKNKKVMPHTDATSKLFSMIYYFANDNWTEKEDGNTNFWDIKQNFSKWLNWKNLHIKDENYNDFINDNYIWHKSIFTKNKMVGFIKSDRSWHSVDNINLKEGSAREVLNIFIKRVD